MNMEIKDRRVAEVLALISSAYNEPLTGPDLARHVRLSSSRLHGLFRLYTGSTPRAALLATRMAKAAELLRTTNLLVKEIASMVGIHDDSHFVRTFEEVFHSTPTEYRNAATTTIDTLPQSLARGSRGKSANK